MLGLTWRASSPDKKTMNIFGVGPFELFLILVLGLIVLGPERLQQAGRSAGRLVARLLAWQQQSPEAQMVQQIKKDFEQEIVELRNEMQRTRKQLDVNAEIRQIREETNSALSMSESPATADEAGTPTAKKRKSRFAEHSDNGNEPVRKRQSEPPASQPSESEPPASQPSESEPPASQPSESDPPAGSDAEELPPHADPHTVARSSSTRKPANGTTSPPAQPTEPAEATTAQQTTAPGDTTPADQQAALTQQVQHLMIEVQTLKAQLLEVQMLKAQLQARGLLDDTDQQQPAHPPSQEVTPS